MLHKFGFHVNRTGNDVFDAIRRIQPAVIKTLDHDIGFWTRVRNIHPNVFLIGRDFVPNHEQDQYIQAPTTKGRAFAERILNLEVNRTLVNNRHLFDAWESYNEVLFGHSSTDQKRAYDEFQVAFAAPIQAAGFAPIAMNFATGNMVGEDFLQHFAGTLDTYTYLGFHEYDWPTLWRIHEENILEKNEGGMWLALRYRRIMNEVRKAHGDRHRVIITECGMTQGVQGGDDVGPWHESHPISEQSYWDSLAWYNGELLRDDYVAGTALFVVGAINPWQSFEHLGGMIDRIEQLQQGNPPPVTSRPKIPEAPIPIPPVISPPDPTPVEPVPVEPEPVEPTEPEPTMPDTPDALRDLLLRKAAIHQLIRFNPGAALQKRIFAEGFVPNSNEFTIEHDGTQYVVQRAEHLASGEVRVYFVKVNDWGNVQYVVRG